MFIKLQDNEYPLGENPSAINKFWAQKIGPGGIRTHDQGIMSPLRYRCATGPSFLRCWVNGLFFFHLACGSFALPSSPRKILNLPRRSPLLPFILGCNPYMPCGSTHRPKFFTLLGQRFILFSFGL